MFTDIITLYNYHKDSWKRTILTSVQVSDTMSLSIDSTNEERITSQLTITVPYREGYKDQVTYDGSGFTFGTNGLDVIVLGNVDDEITDEFTISDLIRKYEKIGIIASVTDNTRRTLLKYWRVKTQ